MENYENVGHRMGFLSSLEIYKEACHDMGVPTSDTIAHLEEMEVNSVTKYLMVKQEFRKLVEERILPEFKKKIDEFYPEKERLVTKAVLKSSFDDMPDIAYAMFKKIFKTLGLIKAGHIKDVKSYIANSIRNMSLDEIIYNYDFLFGSVYGDELLQGIVDEVRRNPNLPPETRDYFRGRMDSLPAVPAGVEKQ